MNRCQTLGLPSVCYFCGSKVLRYSTVPSSKWQLMLSLEVGCQFHRALGKFTELGTKVHAKGAKLRVKDALIRTFYHTITKLDDIITLVIKRK